MKTIKVIDLKKRTIYVDDIEQIYRDNTYTPERYNIQTTYGTYLVDKEDYFKVKDYLLSLNDEVEIIEDKKIETIDPIDYCHSTDTSKDMVLVEKINEIIDFINEGRDEE